MWTLIFVGYMTFTLWIGWQRGKLLQERINTAKKIESLTEENRKYLNYTEGQNNGN